MNLRYFIFPVAFIGFMPVSAMQNLQPSLARKCFSRAMTSLKLGFEFGFIGHELIKSWQANQNLRQMLDMGVLDEAPEQVVHFVQNELKKNDVQKAEQVSVLAVPNSFPSIVALTLGDREVIGIPYGETAGVAIASDPNQTDKQVAQLRAEYQGILSHEAQHIKNNDAQSKNAFAVASPFITAASAKALGLATKVVLPSAYLKVSQFAYKTFLNDLVKPLVGYAKYGISNVLRNAYSRHIEQRADDNMLEDKSYLENFGHWLDREHRMEVAGIMKRTKMSKAQVERELKFRSFIYDEHPYTPIRVMKIYERVKKLKEEGN